MGCFGNEAPGLIIVRYIAGNDVEDAENDDVDRHLNRHLVTNEDAKDDGPRGAGAQLRTASSGNHSLLPC